MPCSQTGRKIDSLDFPIVLFECRAGACSRRPEIGTISGLSKEYYELIACGNAVLCSKTTGGSKPPPYMDSRPVCTLGTLSLTAWLRTLQGRGKKPSPVLRHCEPVRRLVWQSVLLVLPKGKARKHVQSGQTRRTQRLFGEHSSGGSRNT